MDRAPRPGRADAADRGVAAAAGPARHVRDSDPASSIYSYLLNVYNVAGFQDVRRILAVFTNKCVGRLRVYEDHLGAGLLWSIQRPVNDMMQPHQTRETLTVLAWQSSVFASCCTNAWTLGLHHERSTART